jgi:hypothetical protein
MLAVWATVSHMLPGFVRMFTCAEQFRLRIEATWTRVSGEEDPRGWMMGGLPLRGGSLVGFC